MKKYNPIACPAESYVTGRNAAAGKGARVLGGCAIINSLVRESLAEN